MQRYRYLSNSSTESGLQFHNSALSDLQIKGDVSQ